jgi:catechol 2,3-dioxygenase-like lactoylglutathione lyase family enzyme
MDDMTLDNIGIGTCDLGRALAFYRRLGFTSVRRSPRGEVMVLGGSTLFLFPAGRADTPPRSGSPLANPPGLDHLSFAVADVDATYRRLRAVGVVFEAAPADTDWGARAACLRDPDGTVIFLLSWLAPELTATAAVRVLRRYLDALQQHPAAEQLLANVVTDDFETGFAGGFVWRGAEGLRDFLGQRDGFFDERHEIRELLGGLVALPGGELGCRTRLEFFLRRWDAPSPVSEVFIGTAYHRWRLRRGQDGTWRVAAQLVERLEGLNESAQWLFAASAEGLNN